jgi:hypothetical protein
LVCPNPTKYAFAWALRREAGDARRLERRRDGVGDRVVLDGAELVEQRGDHPGVHHEHPHRQRRHRRDDRDGPPRRQRDDDQPECGGDRAGEHDADGQRQQLVGEPPPAVLAVEAEALLDAEGDVVAHRCVEQLARGDRGDGEPGDRDGDARQHRIEPPDRRSQRARREHRDDGRGRQERRHRTRTRPRGEVPCDGGGLVDAQLLADPPRMRIDRPPGVPHVHPREREADDGATGEQRDRDGDGPVHTVAGRAVCFRRSAPSR